MRVPIGMLFAVMCLAQAQTTLKIPPVKTTVKLDQQPVDIAIWGTVSPMPSGTFGVALTADLGDLQEHLTPVLSSQLNRSDRCADRLSVERAAIAPAAPSGLLTANVNFERFACVKAFGKQIAKRLVGGHAVIEVNLTHRWKRTTLRSTPKSARSMPTAHWARCCARIRWAIRCAKKSPPASNQPCKN